MGQFIDQFFNGLSDIATQFITFLTTLFQNIFDLFWDPAGGTNNDGSLTILGYFLLISIATGFVIWGFNFIRSLIRVRRNS